jgi:hypothetical protein
MDWAKLKFRIRWGQLAVYDNQWKLISEDQIRELVNELIDLCDSAQRLGDQEQVLNNVWLSFLRHSITNAEWFFNPAIKDRHTRRGCVYFLRDPQNPSVTKVGYTAALRERIRALSSIVTNNDHRLDLIAVAYTDECVPLESALHHYLRSSHTHGEWFLSTNVDSLIAEVKILINHKDS